MKFYLASQSPQRIRLLKEEGYDFVPFAHGVSEPPGKGSPADYAVAMAERKALAVGEQVPSGEFVVAADTVVALGEKILGKASSKGEARAMIESLSGTVHQVITGLCLLKAPQTILCREAIASEVKMEVLVPEKIEDILAGENYGGKAGGCDIEEADFARVIRGSKANVLGFPTERFRVIFNQYISSEGEKNG